ncbi:RmlC-like cupin domain containing protein [Rhypophila decipiens]
MMNTILSTAILALWAATSTVTATPVKPAPTTSSSSGGAPIYTALTPPEIKALQQELLLAPSYKDKEQVLFPPGPQFGSANNVSFQFVNRPTGLPGQDGSVIVGSVDSIPGLIGTNVAAAIGFIGPCGLNVPHLHPRANEFLTVVQGTLIGAVVLEEDAQFTGTTIPQFNPTCEEAIFSAAFDSNDEGRFQVAQTFFSSQPDEVLTASLGNPTFLGPNNLDKLRNNIPAAFVVMVESCAKTCGIKTK